MLGFLRRSTFDIQGLSVRRSLYLALVRSPLAYCSQVWSPQTVTLLYSLERIQRRATKLILSLPFRTEISYKTRLLRLGLLPLCYWHEYLDLVYLFKSIASDPYISVNIPMRTTRRTDPSKGLILNIPRSKTVTFQKSYYCRAPRVWNILPSHLRNCSIPISHFKKELYSYYMNLTSLYFDIDRPQTFKSVCVKCHACRPIPSLAVSTCCY